MEEDLTKVLAQINNKLENKIDDELLRQILAIVAKNPLPEDRDKCQKQIYEIIKYHCGRAKE